MATNDATDGGFRELAQRKQGGVEVVLFWHEGTGELTVCVSDEHSGSYFELAAEPEQALDVFDHPYAHAAFRGIPYEDALLASWAYAEGERIMVNAPGRAA